MMRIGIAILMAFLLQPMLLFAQEAARMVVSEDVPQVKLKSSKGTQIWYKLSKNKQLTLDTNVDGKVSLRVRSYVMQGGSVNNVLTVSQGADAEMLTFPSKAKPAKTNEPKKIIGSSARKSFSVNRGIIRIKPSENGIFQFSFKPSTTVVDVPPARSLAVKEGKAEDDNDKKYGGVLLGAKAGYVFGFGDLSTPAVDFVFGYRLPPLKGMFEIYAQGGWYTSTEIEQHTDPVIGDYESEWLLQGIPHSLNFAANIPAGAVNIYGGFGFEAIWTHFEFETRSALGNIGPTRNESDFSLGHRYFGGVAIPLGPGELDIEIRYSATISENDFSDITGNFGGLGGAMGWVFVF